MNNVVERSSIASSKYFILVPIFYNEQILCISAYGMGHCFTIFECHLAVDRCVVHITGNCNLAEDKSSMHLPGNCYRVLLVMLRTPCWFNFIASFCEP